MEQMGGPIACKDAGAIDVEAFVGHERRIPVISKSGVIGLR
jgi:hypothetical protein